MVNKTKKINSYSKAFSLIELLVVMSIMLIMTTAILFRQSKFSSDIMITNMAYEIALSIREAEIYGVSGKIDSANKVGYGIRFEIKPVGDPSNTYQEFIDEPLTEVGAGEDNVYDYFKSADASKDPVIGPPVVMTQGNIKRFCGRQGPSSMVCREKDDNGDIGQVLDIVFVKPNPEAHITMGTESGGRDTTPAYSEAIIVIESALGDKCRTVRISGSGQASVDPIDPSPTVDACDQRN